MDFSSLKGVRRAMSVEELYRIHYLDIFCYVQSLVRREDVAQDLTQDTFVRACENPHITEQQNNKKAKAWLLTVARNLCIDYWRKMQKENLKLVFKEVDFSQIPLYGDDPLHSIKSKELKNVIQTAIDSLKWEHQEAIYLFDLKQFSYRESAMILGISEVAFASLLKRARKALISEMLKNSAPNLAKEPLSERELKKLIYWFDILDFPINLEVEVATKTRNFFNGFNEGFEAFRKGSYPEGLNDYLISTVTMTKDDVVADFGCGSGSLTFKLSPHVRKVYAIDHSVEMLNRLKEQMKNKQCDNIQPVYDDVSSNFSFPAETFDVGFCCMLLHHIYDPRAALKQVAKTLVPGGRLVIADLTYTNLNWKFKELHDFWSGFKPDQLSKWLEDSGFKVLNIEENYKYSFKFFDIKNGDLRIEVPLLYAYCVRDY